MAFRIKINEVIVEEVRNGKNKYDKATVNYVSNGQARDQKIMSFSNPAVFKTVQYMKPGEEYDVDITKNDAGYNTWSKVVRVADAADSNDAGAPASTGKASVATPRSTGSWETPEERKLKQLYIIKQSI